MSIPLFLEISCSPRLLLSLRDMAWRGRVTIAGHHSAIDRDRTHSRKSSIARHLSASIEWKWSELTRGIQYDLEASARRTLDIGESEICRERQLSKQRVSDMISQFLSPILIAIFSSFFSIPFFSSCVFGCLFVSICLLLGLVVTMMFTCEISCIWCNVVRCSFLVVYNERINCNSFDSIPIWRSSSCLLPRHLCSIISIRSRL